MPMISDNRPHRSAAPACRAEFVGAQRIAAVPIWRSRRIINLIGIGEAEPRRDPARRRRSGAE